VEDSTVFLTVRSTPVALTVVTYTYSQRPTRDRLLQASRGTDGAFEIFLVHQPAAALIDFARAKGYNLFLAGHTHGGGIAFGIPGLFLVAPATFESRFVSGFHKVGDMLVSVTNGLGFTLAPIRYHAPAEITVLQLKK
jgi:predicted MPP superfamily phosphohydrolase